MGLIAVLTGPSGVGKNTICAMLLERFAHLRAAETVSSSTRQPRIGEEHGVHYYFISRAEFEEQIARGEFLEYATYGGNLYGTNRRMLEELCARCGLVFMVIEIQGCRQLMNQKINPLIFPIVPDDAVVLEERIRARQGTPEADIARRLTETGREITAIGRGEFGRPVVNRRGHVEQAVAEIQGRIEALLP